MIFNKLFLFGNERNAVSYSDSLLYSYLLLINFSSFILFGTDKLIAKKKIPSFIKKNRISEKSLHLASLFGGTPGSILAMVIFRHKTKKIKFIFTTFSIALMQLLFFNSYLI